MNKWLCAAALIALPALTGCGGSSSSSGITPTLTPRSVSTTLSNGLTATLTEDRSTVAVGGTVNYTVLLKNNTAQPITFEGGYGGYSVAPVPAALEVTSPSGKRANPPEAGDTLGYYVSTTLAPGQSVTRLQPLSTDTSNPLEIEGYATAGQYTAQDAFVFGATGVSSAADTVGPLTVTAQ